MKKKECSCRNLYLETYKSMEINALITSTGKRKGANFLSKEIGVFRFVAVMRIVEEKNFGSSFCERVITV